MASHFMTPILVGLEKHSSKLLMKRYIGTPSNPAWKKIFFQDFIDDLNKTTAYWSNLLSSRGIAQNDVVGIWLTGKQYEDLVQIYSLARAGYVPQVFNIFMSPQGPAVIRDLLAENGAKIVLYDHYFSEIVVHDLGVPYAKLVDVQALPSLPSTSKLPDLPEVKDTDPAIIFFTSGTTSGRPKPIIQSHRWARCQAQVQWPGIWQRPFKGQAVFNNLGSFSNVGSATAINFLSWSGAACIQQPKPNFDADEFLAMIKEGLNAMLLYAPWLSNLLNVARTNNEVLTAMKNMVQITYTGVSLNPEDEAWISEQKLPVAVLYATTEAACCMISEVEPSTLPNMRVITGMKVELIPRGRVDKAALDGNVEKRAQGGDLFDFFVPDTSDNCPDPTIRNRPNGHVTGDLFEETSPGFYAFRGRSDDWIRTGITFSFCDTKSIEDNVLLHCADLVRNCVVVGHYKPAPVLVVETVNVIENKEAETILKEGIIRQLTKFNNSLFLHERIDDPRQIIIAATGSLPRTKEKGNIRRKAVEDDHAEVLKEIYAVVKK